MKRRPPLEQTTIYRQYGTVAQFVNKEAGA
jgi:hypothetical protein